MKKWLIMQNFGQIFKLFAFFKEKKGLISENFCYKARVKPWRFWKNWWFFGNFFEKLAQNGQILQTHFAKIPWKHWQFWWRKSTFRFSRKNRPIFKTAFCQNNEKFREKKGLTSDLPRFTSIPELSKIRKIIANIIVRLTREKTKKLFFNEFEA